MGNASKRNNCLYLGCPGIPYIHLKLRLDTLNINNYYAYLRYPLKLNYFFWRRRSTVSDEYGFIRLYKVSDVKSNVKDFSNKY